MIGLDLGLGLLRAFATTVVLVALYYLLPLSHFHNVPVAWRAWTYPSPAASNTEQYYFSK